MRKWVITVEDFDPPRTDRIYLVRVGKPQRNTDPPGIKVPLEHLDEDQAGRIREEILPLRARPAGLTASFFRACGFEVSIGSKIAPEDAEGKVIGIQVGPTQENPWNVVDFKRIGEKAHEPNA